MQDRSRCVAQNAEAIKCTKGSLLQFAIFRRKQIFFVGTVQREIEHIDSPSFMELRLRTDFLCSYNFLFECTDEKMESFCKGSVLLLC